MNIQPGFNVRVYGLLLSADQRQVLLVHEVIEGRQLLKFPGGGVELAEAPGQALIREFKEELGAEVELKELFYVSPIFHRSIFRPQQLIGLYWQVQLRGDYDQLVPQIPSLQVIWRDLNSLRAQDLTHSLDQEVAQVLLARCGGA